MVKIQLVVMRQACAACTIINNLNIETMEKIKAKYPNVVWKLIEINHPKELRQVEGLEVEKLPAVLINGEQFTAGTVLPPRRLSEILDAIE